MKLTETDIQQLSRMGATTDEMPRIQAVASYSKATLPKRSGAYISHPNLIKLMGRAQWLSAILYAARNRVTECSLTEWGDALNNQVEIRFSLATLPKGYIKRHPDIF